MANYITKEGLEKLEQELEYLVNTKRREIAERIRHAASYGDLSENFAYSSAKEEQGMTEQKIAELQDTIRSSLVVEKAASTGKVQLGSVVVVKTNSAKLTFTITGPQEADPMQGKLSAESPLGKLLVGKKKGDSFELKAPGAVIKYMILDIS
jgi:transcription elongation factor GreA